MNSRATSVSSSFAHVLARTRARHFFQFFCRVLLLLGATLSFVSGQVSAHEDSSPPASALSQDVVKTLENLTQLLMNAGPQPTAAAMNEPQPPLLSTAVTRQQLLQSIIAEHPEEVLRLTIPNGLRSSLPSDIQLYMEKQVMLEGTVTVLCQEGEKGDCLHYLLDTGQQNLSLYFTASPSASLQTGAQVRIHGVQVGNALALQPYNASLSQGPASFASQAATTPAPLGEQRVLVLLINFQDKPTERPYTVDYARTTVFDQANKFFRENSKGQTWLSGDVYGWYTIPLASTQCDSSQISSLAQQAARNAGVNLSAYTHYVFASPRGSCSWGGLGTIGGAPSFAWINDSNPPAKLFAHELGHNLGLYHSNAWECGSATIGGSCSTIEYGDAVDNMGTGPGHYNVFQKERLGWLPDSITEVSTDGVYLLAPHENAAGADPQALKIKRDASRQNWYYVEYRQPVGFDNFLNIDLFANVRGGIVIHTGSTTNGNSSNLLDMTPETTSWFDPALSVGRSFTDPVAGLTISPLWVNFTKAAVQISSTPSTCAPNDPTVLLSPSASQWVRPGTTVSYSLTITNRDSAPCAPSNFALHYTAPSGWTASSPAPTLTINPGSSASAALQVTSPVSATDGFYTVTAQVERNATSHSENTASATYVVASGLQIAVSTDRPSYPQRAWVTAQATVSFANSPLKGAKVIFAITKPDGKVLKKTLTTGKDGIALFRWRLQTQDPVGTYGVTTNASLKNVNPGEATTSFTVQ